MSWQGFKGDIMKKMFLGMVIFIIILKFGATTIDSVVDTTVAAPLKQHIQGF